MIDISLARKRAEDALEREKLIPIGSWILERDRDNGNLAAIYDGHKDGFPVFNPDLPLGYGVVAEFIAASRTDVPALAQDLLQALEEIERLKMLFND